MIVNITMRIKTRFIYSGGPGSVDGIEPGYGLGGPGIESAHDQTDHGAQSASCKMGTGSFPGVKRGRCVTLAPQPLVVSWSRKSRAIPLLLLWPTKCTEPQCLQKSALLYSALDPS